MAMDEANGTDKGAVADEAESEAKANAGFKSMKENRISKESNHQKALPCRQRHTMSKVLSAEIPLTNAWY
jgi:hypothetical protein